MDKKNVYNNYTILIAGHDKDDRKIILDIIQDKFKTITADTEEEVLQLLQDSSKKISGAIFSAEKAKGFLEEIRVVPALEEFPVLVSLKESNHDLENELIELDVIDFLKAPYSARRTLNRLKTLVKLSNANHLIYELERDELTGLYTRQAFLRKADQIRKENLRKRFCVMAFDFDNFKSSNTMYGEEKCNDFLAYTGRKLKGVLPKGIAGRFGGDQFILFFAYEGEQVDVGRLNDLTSSILAAAPIPHQVVKIGVNAPIDNKQSMVVCCDRAFLAIREIKGIYGKNLAFYESKLQKQLLDEQRIIETMEQSLKKEEFKVFYQPKHETITGEIVGAEALVRWNHEEYGFMSPGQFIPLFEKNGFISKLDVYMLEHVCQDLKRWKKSGLPLVPVSVNVSRHDFIEPGCIDSLIKLVDRYKIDHSLIHMEVTESLYSENTDLIIDQVKKIQELGFMIEMDDFGAGYSSLGLLSTFPLNILKLDITFVRNIETNEIVIENIIKMAHRLGLLTVAEGAETNEQVATLKTLGCDFIQGYYYSKPLPVLEYENYLGKSKKHKERINLQELEGEEEASDENDWHMNENMLLAATEVAESVPGGFFSYHADGDLEIISFNRELLNLFACKNAEEFREYTGNSFRGIVYKDDFEYVQKSIESQITKENTLDYVEYRIKAKDGTMKYLRDYGRFVKTKKYGDIFYVFLYDATEEERWKINAQLNAVKGKELERSVNLAKSANHAKNIFISNIVLDILPRINTVIECTDKIWEKLGNKTPVKEEISTAKKAEEHLLNLVNNLRELAILENGNLKLAESPTDLTGAAKKTASLIEDFAREKGVKIEYWEEIYNPYIYQDLIHTTDVVFNIAQNAVKYTPKGGTVKLGIRQTPGNNKNECNIEFICEDNGVGISKEFMPYICKPFAREDNKINRKHPSSGLGLHLAKSLLIIMNGTIEFSSEPGIKTIVKTCQPHRFAKKEDVEKETFLTQNVR